MAIATRRCTICGHQTRQQVGCIVDDCEYSSKIHDHCGHEECGEPDQHGICTTAGCMAVTEDLGLVNPEVG